MTLPDLMHTLDARGVRLSARLVVDAPAGAVTQELRDALASHKLLLIQEVVREALWADLSTWRWGQACGDPTPGIILDGRSVRTEDELRGLDRRSRDNDEDV